jgi:hypothetical protein
MVTGFAELGFAGQGGSLPWRVLVRVQERRAEADALHARPPRRRRQHDP